MATDQAIPARSWFTQARTWLLTTLLGISISIAATADTRPTIQPAVLLPTLSITLDGRLDEPVWRDAAVVKLVQQAPKPGQRTVYETEVRVILASDRIYFGFHCKDPNPARIAVGVSRCQQKIQLLNGRVLEKSLDHCLRLCIYGFAKPEWT
jgi:hypothetical protein